MDVATITMYPTEARRRLESYRRDARQGAGVNSRVSTHSNVACVERLRAHSERSRALTAPKSRRALGMQSGRCRS